MKSTEKALGAKDMLLRYGFYVIFVLVAIFFSFQSANFLTITNILTILQQSAPLILGVVGMAFVMTDAGIDISAGSSMYLAAVICSLAVLKMADSGMNVNAFWVYAAIMLLGIFVGGIIGALNGFLIARLNMVPFIVTLITTSIARGIGMFLADAKGIMINLTGFKLNDKKIGNISILIIIAVLVLLIFHYIYRYTTFGLQLKAQGNNHEAAKKIGINTTRNTWIVYMICGALCGFGGILSAGMSGAVPISFADGNEFIIIPAAVLGGISLFGGKGSIIPGSIFGILMINTIVNGLTMMSANPYVYTIVRGIIIFLAVMIDCMKYKGELR